MRLTCPTCGAQYEVPAEVIPETGRDVQCSECGSTWFQHHPDHPAAENVLEEGVADTEAKGVTDTPEAQDATDVGDEAQDLDGADYSAEEEEDEFAGFEETVADEAHEDDVSREEDTSSSDEDNPEDEEWQGVSDIDEDPDLVAEAGTPSETEIADPEIETKEEAIEEDVSDSEEPESDSDLEALSEVDEPDAETVQDDGSSDETSPEQSEADDTSAEAPPRKPLDENVAAVLRQEAEREAQAREDERLSGLETQPELGLTQHDSTAQQRTLEAEARMARLRGDDTLASDSISENIASTMASEDLDIDPSSRSNLLPDIDEINSSLDPQTGRGTEASAEATGAAAPKKTSGFRTGFRLAVVIAVIATLLYVFAPQLSGSVPQLDGALSGYVGAVDGIRAQLDGLVEAIVASIEEPASE